VPESTTGTRTREFGRTARVRLRPGAPSTDRRSIRHASARGPLRTERRRRDRVPDRRRGTDIVFIRGITGDLLSTWEQPMLVRHVEGLAELGRASARGRRAAVAPLPGRALIRAGLVAHAQRSRSPSITRSARSSGRSRSRYRSSSDIHACHCSRASGPSRSSPRRKRSSAGVSTQIE
jgi:hypothetical protein